MSYIHAYNNLVATEPFKQKDIEIKVENMWGTVNQKLTLTPLKVVFPGGALGVHHTVYVTADCFKHEFANKVYNLDGQDFILVPLDQVKLTKYDRPETIIDSRPISRPAQDCEQEQPVKVNLDADFQKYTGQVRDTLDENINSR